MKNFYRAAGIAGALLILAAGAAFGQQADVVYLEGFPELKESAGGRFEMDFGDLVRPGDSVITGRTDYVELEQAGANTIRVAADTVFTLQEVEEDGETQTVLSTTVGSVAFRFNQITGREPRIATPATVAGIRGTELTVYAGSDGSALFLVDEGLVDVEAQGVTVSLTENEGVEVPAGGPPGEKFFFPDRQLDFSSWNEERIEAFLESPVDSMRRIKDRLAQFEQEIVRLTPIIEEYTDQVEEIRAELERLDQEGNSEEIARVREELFFPTVEQRRFASLNQRYYALSALSLRRFVVGRLYVEMKQRYLLEQSSQDFAGFMELYKEILNDFESSVVPQLVAADI